MAMQILTFGSLLVCAGWLVSLNVCDVRDDSLDQVDIDKAPWAVLVLPNNNKLFCSGVLLSLEWVLTAAHCMFNELGAYTEDDQSVTVVAGSARGQNDANTQARQSQKLVLHNRYNFAENFLHDLVLIQVQKPFTNSTWVGVPRLIRKNNFHNVVSSRQFSKRSKFGCTVYGFGRVRRSRISAKDNSLKSQDFQVSRQCECLRRIRSSRSTGSILETEETLLCRELTRATGMCDGDNGSPLFTQGVLRGIGTTVIYYKEDSCQLSKERYDCGDPRTLSVFTDLCPYGEWLSKRVPGYPNTDDRCQVWDTTFK